MLHPSCSFLLTAWEKQSYVESRLYTWAPVILYVLRGPSLPHCCLTFDISPGGGRVRVCTGSRPIAITCLLLSGLPVVCMYECSQSTWTGNYQRLVVDRGPSLLDEDLKGTLRCCLVCVECHCDRCSGEKAGCFRRGHPARLGK